MRLRRAAAILVAGFAALAGPVLPAQAAPVPLVDCITPTGTAPNVWWVYYGYVNSGSQLTVPFGDENTVVPGLGYQGQPDVFNVGSYPRVFRAIFNAEAFTQNAWELAGGSAIATLGSPRCAAGATGPVSELTATGATLHGLVEPDGAQTAYSFNYGTTIAYGQSTLERQTSSASGVLASEPISGLQPGTTYHYRLVASSGTVTTVGEDRTFTTPEAVEPTPTPPVAAAPPPAVPAPVVQFVPVAPAAPAAAPRTDADLVLMRRGPRQRVRVGQTITIRLTTRNRGPATAVGIGLVHRLGDGLRLVSARGAAGRCWGRTTVRCPLGTLRAGAQRTVTLRVRVSRSGRLWDTATVAADGPETRAADNTVAGAFRARGR